MAKACRCSPLAKKPGRRRGEAAAKYRIEFLLDGQWIWADYRERIDDVRIGLFLEKQFDDPMLDQIYRTRSRVSLPSYARIVEKATGEIVHEYGRPLFQAGD